MQGDLIAFDLETTGLNPASDEIIEVGLARFREGEVVDEYQSLVKPSKPIPSDISHLTGIHQEDVEDAPDIDEILPDLRNFFGSATVVAHNVGFDRAFLRKYDLLERNQAIDTFELASIVMPSAPRYSLGSLVTQLDVKLERAHRALDDAVATGHLYWRLWLKLGAMPSGVLAEILRAGDGLDWGLRDIFQAALDRSLRNFVPQRPIVPFESERVDIPPLDLDKARHDALAPTAIEAVFGAQGKLAAGFGDYEIRDEQLQMAHEVTAALNQGEHLMIEAGTGTGKSLAYLLPAALWAMQNDQRVTVSTNTINLQEQTAGQRYSAGAPCRWSRAEGRVDEGARQLSVPAPLADLAPAQAAESR